MQELKKIKLLTVDQVHRILGCSKSHVYNLIDQQILPAVKIGVRMGIRIRKSDVINFINQSVIIDD